MAGYNSIKILRGNSSTVQNLANNGTTLLDGQLLYIKDKNYLSVGTTSAGGSLSPINTSPITVRELRGYPEDVNGITSNTDRPYYINYVDDGLNIHSPLNVDITAPGEISSTTSGTLSFQGMTWNENVSNKQVTAQAAYSINTSIYSLNGSSSLSLNSPSININASSLNVGSLSSSTSAVPYLKMNTCSVTLQGNNSVSIVACNSSHSDPASVTLFGPNNSIELRDVNNIHTFAGAAQSLSIEASGSLNLIGTMGLNIESTGSSVRIGNFTSDPLYINAGAPIYLNAPTIWLNANNRLALNVNQNRIYYGSINSTTGLPDNYVQLNSLMNRNTFAIHCITIFVNTSDGFTWDTFGSAANSDQTLFNNVDHDPQGFFTFSLITRNNTPISTPAELRNNMIRAYNNNQFWYPGNGNFYNEGLFCYPAAIARTNYNTYMDLRLTGRSGMGISGGVISIPVNANYMRVEDRCAFL